MIISSAARHFLVSFGKRWKCSGFWERKSSLFFKARGCGGPAPHPAPPPRRGPPWKWNLSIAHFWLQRTPLLFNIPISAPLANQMQLLYDWLVSMKVFWLQLGHGQRELFVNRDYKNEILIWMLTMFSSLRYFTCSLQLHACKLLILILKFWKQIIKSKWEY